jgi:hypothetical protein
LPPVYEVEVVVDPLLLEVVDPAVEVLVELELLVVLFAEATGVVQALLDGAETPPLL